MIELAIKSLVQYGIDKALIKDEDRIYIRNQLLGLLGLFEYQEPVEDPIKELKAILDLFLSHAIERGLIDDNITDRDLFDSKIMGVLTPRPSAVNDDFWKLYNRDPKCATDRFYALSQDCNYIRMDRIKKDLKWVYHSLYGDIDITINMSKPEKDPKSIAAAKNQAPNSYPTCALCKENEGYFGSANQQARENIRLVPLTLGGEPWFFQYSPYVYYNEHCIVLSANHRPMKIDEMTFDRLTEFVEKFPHYILGSNADLPIVGGSILSHDHYQGGNFTFPMARATLKYSFQIPAFSDVQAGVLNWPVSVIRLTSKSRKSLVKAASHILEVWRHYTDETAAIYAVTDGELHNTISPIARKKGDEFELDLALRNNLTTADRPLGLYHPREEYWHIKKENIGLIEVMGLAILPSRLKKELELLKKALITHQDIAASELLSKHAAWAASIVDRYLVINEKNIDKIIEDEIGLVFVKVLEDAGVFKGTADGEAAFRRFIASL